MGLPREEAETVLSQRSFRGAVDRDWSLSRERGISAVPTFVLNDRVLVGAHPYEVLERFVMAQGVQKRKRM